MKRYRVVLTDLTILFFVPLFAMEKEGPNPAKRARGGGDPKAVAAAAEPQRDFIESMRSLARAVELQQRHAATMQDLLGALVQESLKQSQLLEELVTVSKRHAVES